MEKNQVGRLKEKNSTKKREREKNREMSFTSGVLWGSRSRGARSHSLGKTIEKGMKDKNPADGKTTPFLTSAGETKNQDLRRARPQRGAIQ